MSFAQIYSKVQEVGEARAYFSIPGSTNDTFYRGQRGDLKLDNDGILVFMAECGPDKDCPFYIGRADDIHAPSIGHYTW